MTQINDDNSYPRRYRHPDFTGSRDMRISHVDGYRCVSAWYLVLGAGELPRVSTSSWADVDPSVVFRNEEQLIEAGYRLVGSGS